MQSDTLKKYLVFISHSSKDTWVAERIAQEVSNCGASSFLDEHNVDVGRDFDEEIRQSLNQSNELLVLLTPWALERPYIWAELGAAWVRSILIVGVLHGVSRTELQSNPAIPVFLKERNLIELNDLNEYFRQLTKRVAAGLTEQPEPEL